jgi:hypothetical protein
MSPTDTSQLSNTASEWLPGCLLSVNNMKKYTNKPLVNLKLESTYTQTGAVLVMKLLMAENKQANKFPVMMLKWLVKLKSTCSKLESTCNNTACTLLLYHKLESPSNNTA